MKYSIDNFRALSRELDGVYDNFIVASKMASAEYWALFMICEGTNTQAEIGKQLLMSKQTVNSALKQLIEKGFVRTERDGNDLRAKRCILTEKGREIADRYIKAAFAMEDEVWENLEKDERESLIKITEKYIELSKKSLNKYLVKE